MEKIKEKLLEMISLYDMLKYKTNKTEQEEHLYYIVYKMLEGVESFTELYSNYKINNGLEKDLRSKEMDNQVQSFLDLKLSATVPPAKILSHGEPAIEQVCGTTKPTQKESMDWLAFGTAAAMTGLLNPIIGTPLEHQQINDFHSMMKDVKFDDHND
jgi:hypothetical protein